MVRRVEECCTRFDPRSKMMQLTTRAGVPVPVSALLYEAVQFAVSVAEESGGAFDPTIGQPMETRGFNREYRTREGCPDRSPSRARWGDRVRFAGHRQLSRRYASILPGEQSRSLALWFSTLERSRKVWQSTWPRASCARWRIMRSMRRGPLRRRVQPGWCAVVHRDPSSASRRSAD
jgi:hypothetical protein